MKKSGWIVRWGGWEKHNYIWTESFTSQFQRTNIWALSQKSSEGGLITLWRHPQWLEKQTHNPPVLWEVYKENRGTHAVILSRLLKNEIPFSSLKERKKKKKQDRSKQDVWAWRKEDPKKNSEQMFPTWHSCSVPAERALNCISLTVLPISTGIVAFLNPAPTMTVCHNSGSCSHIHIPFPTSCLSRELGTDRSSFQPTPLGDKLVLGVQKQTIIKSP